jgi:hypothetical protein
MDTHQLECLARERLDEARAQAATWAMVRSLRPARQPLRVWMGLTLIRWGRWLAQRTPKRATEPGRVTA